MNTKAIVILVIAMLLLFNACATTSNQLVERQPTYQPTPDTSSRVELPKVTTPKLAEVEDAVRRIFKQAAKVDQTSNPSFIVGDFNGDKTEDLAVVVKPIEISTLNEQYPAWLLRDPLSQSESPSTPLRVNENESLLAVIHGYGENDWRDPQATQTFLLKNVAGGNMQTKSGVDFVKGNSGRRLPPLRGDVIAKTVHGSLGVLYFASSTYRWYDPKTFRDDGDVVAVHGLKMKKN